MSPRIPNIPHLRLLFQQNRPVAVGRAVAVSRAGIRSERSFRAVTRGQVIGHCGPLLYRVRPTANGPVVFRDSGWSLPQSVSLRVVLTLLEWSVSRTQARACDAVPKMEKAFRYRLAGTDIKPPSAAAFKRRGRERLRKRHREGGCSLRHGRAAPRRLVLSDCAGAVEPCCFMLAMVMRSSG
jgi:hypothetical protein